MATGGEAEKKAKEVEQTNVFEKESDGNRAYVAMGTDRGEETKSLEKPTYELNYQSVKDLHEKGKQNKGGGKQGELSIQNDANFSV